MTSNEQVVTYGLVMTQESEGCDYTIGCGTRFVPLPDAVDGAHAGWLARRYMHEDDASHLRNPEQVINKLLVVRVIAEMPVDEWRENLEASDRTRQQQADEAIERATLARLQHKYEGRS